MTLVDLRGCGSWVRIVASGGAVVAFHRLQKGAFTTEAQRTQKFQATCRLMRGFVSPW